MKLLPLFLTPCCLALLCLSLTSCSSHNNKIANQRAAQYEAGVDSDEVALSETEESANEELAALKGLKAQQRMTLKQAGIDARKYDFPIVLNDQVQYYLDLFQGKQRNYYARWLARSTAYRPHIEAELAKAGLPKDLVFLAMIESGYNPSAYSPANACGLWQFIAGTGRTYGLKINSWVDERREPLKATKAAIGYLSKLHRQFDDWYLAVAAYNTGEKRIADAVETYDTKDFWTIADSDSLYLETKRYVPKLIAAIIIGRDPERFGFTDIQYHQPQQYEQIAVPGGSSLEAVAKVAHTSVKQLRTLNNELRKNQTPPNGRYLLHIPFGTKSLVAANINNLKPIRRTLYASHTVKRGETLSQISQRYHISMNSMRKANGLRSSTIRIGQRLRIPRTTTQYVLAQNDAPKRSIGRGNNKTLRQSSVSIALAPKATKKSPLTSKPAVVLASSKKQRVAPRTIAASKTKTSKTAVNALPTVVVAKAAPKKPRWYVIKNGDTLSTIARRFNTSANDLRKLNKLSDNLLRTGNKLLIKKG